MKVLLTLGFLLACPFLFAQDCAHELSISPNLEQIDSERELFLVEEGRFVIVKENMTLIKANAILEELAAVGVSGGTLDARYEAIRTVLNCMKENEMLN